MREEYAKQLNKNFLKPGMIAGLIMTAFLAAGQILFWFVEGEKRTNVVMYTRGISTYVCIVMGIIIVGMIVVLQLTVRASYLSQFYINRSELVKAKRLYFTSNAILFGGITLGFQAIYTIGQCENVIGILSLQFICNILLMMTIVLWGDNVTMFSGWATALYLTIVFAILIRDFVVYKYHVDFLITDVKMSMIWIGSLLAATVAGLIVNEKLTKREDCVKGVEANE